jgi:general secretion pathway protein I
VQIDITAREKISGAPASLTILRPAGMLLEANAPLPAN